MIRTVADKELRSALRDGRVLAGGLGLFLLGLVALLSAGAHYEALSRERVAAQAVVAQQWREQGEKNPHSAAHYGLYAFRPALPLAFFDPGVSSYEGVSIWLEAHKRNFATGRPADDMTPLLRFGELSLAVVFQTLLPVGLILWPTRVWRASARAAPCGNCWRRASHPGSCWPESFWAWRWRR